METAGKAKNLSYLEFGRAERESPWQIQADQAPRISELEQANATNAKLRAALSEAVALLQPAQEEIERLHTQLLEAKGGQRKDTIEVAAVETRKARPESEPNDELTDLAHLQRQALREEILRQEERRQRAWWRLGR